MRGRTPGRLSTAVGASVAGVLCVLVVTGTFVWPPVMAVAGAARAAPVSLPAPAPTTTASAPSATPTPARTRTARPAPKSTSNRTADAAPRPVTRAQPRGTVRLPHGGTARLVRKELEPGGVLPVPENLDEATWWGAGLTSRTGATVFAGHVNWKGRTGPFAGLWQSRIADRVTVVDGKGKRWSYRVAQVLTVDKDELPDRAERLFGRHGPHRLVLVTCGGRWVGGSDGYEANRVVIAEPE